MRVALGTVQFGLKYGVANSAGAVPAAEATAILRSALAGGINMLDTAVAYGDAERVLGEAGMGSWRIVSKLPALPLAVASIGDWVRTEVEASLRRLGVPRLYGLLLHRAADLAGPFADELWQALRERVDARQVEKIGVSIYGPDDLAAISWWSQLQLVQAPYNVLDRRLLTTGWGRRLVDAGVELHARSVFLQGLLLLPPERRPAKFKRWAPLWARWESYLAETRQTPLEACLHAALAEAAFARVVVGVESVGQLQEVLVAATGRPAAVPLFAPGDVDAELIDPSRWDRL